MVGVVLCDITVTIAVIISEKDRCKECRGAKVVREQKILEVNACQLIVLFISVRRYISPEVWEMAKK